MLKRVWLCVVFVGLCLSMVAPSWAQAPVGSLTGTVRDQSGLVMVGVQVIVVNKDTGNSRQLVTSTTGTFSAASLQPGNYIVKATAEGFRPLEVNATVQVGQATNVDLELQVGAETDVVNVQAEAAQISYDSHEIAGVITQKDMQSLPLNGRSFLQLSMLQPGVSVTANNVGQYNKQFDVSILGAGSANNSVRITVDGATVSDAINGGTQQNFSQEVVQEFQLSSTNFDLSTGIGAGGAINIVTRSGGNDFHGSGFFFYRDHNMSAYPFLAHYPGPSSPYFARKQEGYVVGGPVKKDKLFFFSALEHIDQTALVPAFPSDPLLAGLGTFASSPYHANELTDRLDWHINDKHTAFLRYSHDGNNSFAPPGLGNLPSDWTNNTNWADSGVFSLVSVVTPATANEFRYSYTFWSNRNLPPTLSQCPAPCYGWDYVHNQDGPEITVLGVNNFALGQFATAPQTRLLRRHIFADNVSWQHGNHSVKYGGYWEYSKGTGSLENFQPAALELWSPESVANVAPAYAASHFPAQFTTYNDLLKLPVYAFTIGYGNPTQPPKYISSTANHDNQFHVYAEDAWKITPRFTLNYGLAWSYESNALNYTLTKPQFLAPIFGAGGLGHEMNSPHNFSPMLGFAWSLGKDNKTVVRAGAAIYYDTWNIYNRLVETVTLAPVGQGRLPVPDSAIVPHLPSVLDIVTGQPVNTLRPSTGDPTTFGAYEFNLLLPLITQNVAGVINGNYPTGTTNLDAFGTGFGLIPNHFRLPYSEHVSVGIQRELRSDLVVSADFVFRQYMHQLIMGPDLNHFSSAAGPVIPACPKGLTTTPAEAGCSGGPIEGLISGARSHYKGILLKLDKRFSHFTAGGLAYAYASQVGYNGLVDNSNWLASWGPQSGHQTLSGSIIFFLPKGIQVSGITSFQSAPPVQPYISGIDLNGNGVFSVVGESPLTGSPIPGAGFNQFGVGLDKSDLVRLVNQFNQNYAGKTDPLGHPIPAIVLPSSFSFPRSFNSQDLRVTKFFKLRPERLRLSVFGECFNVFNIANLANYNLALTTQLAGSSVLNSPNFGQPTLRTENTFGTGGPRAFQVGARLIF